MAATWKTNTYLSLKQLAEVFGVNERTVRRWISSGTLPAYKLGHQWRISQRDLDAFLQRARRGKGNVL